MMTLAAESFKSNYLSSKLDKDVVLMVKGLLSDERC